MDHIDQKQFYLKSLQKHGKTARGVAWSDEYRQKRRFAALTGAVPNLGESVVADAGCGFGDLWLFMQKSGRLPRRYIGIDMLDPMVEEAKRRTGQRILKRNLLKDPLPEADWYLASGTFNLMSRFETLLALKRIVEVSRCGLVFNLLKGRKRVGMFSFWMPAEIKRVCRSFGRVTIVEGYLDGDFTVRIES